VKKRFRIFPPIRIMLAAGIVLAVVLMAGSAMSCQPEEGAPEETDQGLPTEQSSGSQPSTSPVTEVAIESFTFKPAEIRVPVGGTVTWYNQDSVVHTATARDGTFDSGNMSRGDTFSYTFGEKGVFDYYCVPHPYMEGKVVVE